LTVFFAWQAREAPRLVARDIDMAAVCGGRETLQESGDGVRIREDVRDVHTWKTG
jgi:hypothetical protein